MSPLAILLLLVLAPLAAVSAQSDSTRLEQQLRATVREYSLSADSLFQALHKLSSDLRITMGIEWIRDPGTLHRVNRSWSHATILDIVQFVVAEYPGYEMRTDTGVLQVYPTGSLNESRNILNLRLGPFEVREEPLSMASGWFLHGRVRAILQLPPPGAGDAGSIGSGPGYQRKVSFKSDNPTLREALDAFALAAGQTNWVVTYPEYETAPGRFRETVTRDGKRVREDQHPVWQFVPWDSKGP